MYMQIQKIRYYTLIRTLTLWNGYELIHLGFDIIQLAFFFRLLTDFVCLYNYEFGLSLRKIVRSSVILLLPLFNRTLHNSCTTTKHLFLIFKETWGYLFTNVFPQIFVLVKMLEYIMIDNIFVVIGGRSFNKDLAFQRTLDVIPFSSISSYVCLRGISVISQEKGQ